jgi:hypothetical protein
VSSDLERRVRELADRLRDPSEEATRRAGERALAAARRGRLGKRVHLRWGVSVVIALLLGSGLGFALGTANTSSGNAASAPVGLGFLPEDGWDVLQSGTSATLGSPTVSIAANVDLHPDDDADGLPLSTLQTLPRNGIVIIASFTARGQEPSHDNGFPPRTLPLNIREGAPLGIQLRPDRPLSQYEIRAAIRRHNVYIEIYLGTPKPPRASLAAAQRQLARLVVAPDPSKRTQKELARAALGQFARPLSPAASRVIDRTFACRPDFGNLDVVASPRGAQEVIGGPFTSSGYARVTSGRHGDPLSDLVVAARPGFRMPSIRFPGAVYASSQRCVPSRATVSLTLTGLPGPPTMFLSQGDCTVARRVLVRVRALLTAPATWGSVDAAFVGARGRLLEAELAVRDQRTRKQLALVRVGRTGKTKLWTSSRCA